MFRHARLSWREKEAIRNGIDPAGAKDDAKVEEWTMMRCCVPLDKVSIKGIHDYHSFATLVGLDIELDDQQPAVPTENIAVGDFPGPPTRRRSSAKSASPPGRRFSIKNSLPFVKKAKESEPISKLDRSFSLSFPFGKAKTGSPVDSPVSTPEEFPRPLRRESTAWIDSSFPAGHDDSGGCGMDDLPDSYAFNVSVLNEQAWFVEALEAAVSAAADRKYRAGVDRPKMSLEVAGYDCLATDEDIEGHEVIRQSTASSEERSEEDEGYGSEVSKAMRKSEKATMAAKMFGLKEDEGIWRESVVRGLLTFSQAVLHFAKLSPSPRAPHLVAGIHLLLAKSDDRCRHQGEQGAEAWADHKSTVSNVVTSKARVKVLAYAPLSTACLYIFTGITT